MTSRVTSRLLESVSVVIYYLSLSVNLTRPCSATATGCIDVDSVLCPWSDVSCVFYSSPTSLDSWQCCVQCWCPGCWWV